MAGQVKPIPEGHHALTPYLSIKGASDAIEFYKKAFGATEAFRMAQPDGRIGHAELQLGDCRLMLADEFPEMDFRSPDRKSTRLNSSHGYISYAVFCLKKKKTYEQIQQVS